MVLESIIELSKKYKRVGGIYVIQSREMKEAGWVKVGMSYTDIYNRLNGYVNALPCGFDMHGPTDAE
jgi:hypothetical protein